VNRETKRMMQRQGQVRPDGSPAPREPAQAARAAGSGRKRSSPAEFLRGVRSELRKVAWPTRAEVVNYSTVVLVTLVLVTAAIFGLNYLFSHAVNFLYDA